MKFVISRQDLTTLITKACNVVPQKPTIPILGNILVEAANDEIVITSTDLTVGVRCYGKAKVLEAGASTLPARHFSSLIRELTSENVEVSVSESERVEIHADSSTFKMHGMSKNEFPSLPDLTGASTFQIKEAILKDMLYRTAFAVSREDNRYVLTGVYMTVGNGVATFTGTDGKRLSRAHTSVAVDTSLAGEYIIPLKAVDELLKGLDGNKEETMATVYLFNDKIAVESGQLTVITKLLSGDYPDVERVIPQNSETVVSIHRDELMTLLRQIALFTADTTHSVRFSFNEGELRLSANTMDLGEGKVSMPVNYQGPQLDIAFNPGFFLDILRHSKQETITMGVTDPYNPGIITDTETSAAAAASPSPLFVLMPMRLNEE